MVFLHSPSYKPNLAFFSFELDLLSGFFMRGIHEVHLFGRLMDATRSKISLRVQHIEKIAKNFLILLKTICSMDATRL